MLRGSFRACGSIIEPESSCLKATGISMIRTHYIPSLKRGYCIEQVLQQYEYEYKHQMAVHNAVVVPGVEVLVYTRSTSCQVLSAVCSTRSSTAALVLTYFEAICKHSAGSGTYVEEVQ